VRNSIYLFVDSGAYSAFTRGQPIDLNEWIGFCKKMQRKKPDTMVVNLDVIGAPGEDTGEQSYRNWKIMREAGLDPLPVYHVNSDPKWLKKYMRQTDYVGLGAIADMITHRRMWALDRIWEDYFIDGQRMPKTRVHAMGVTSFPLIRRYPWFSVDSTSWLQAGMYGKIFVPHLKDGEWDYARKPYQMNVSSKSPKLKDKKLHIQNLPPHLRAVLDRFIKENGFVLGKSKMVNGEEEVLESGLANNYYDRCFINSLFYARFIHTLPWPRPFSASRPKGLFV
jgi:hypothetical protein